MVGTEAEPAVRRSPHRVRELLHADFVEHGASGRVWERTATADALAASSEVPGGATDFATVAVARDVVLVTYRIVGPSGSLRSSVGSQRSRRVAVAVPPGDAVGG